MRPCLMSGVPAANIARRDFLKLAGAASVYGMSPNALAASQDPVRIIIDAANAAASSGPAKRAVEQLRNAFTAKGISCQVVHDFAAAAGSSLCIVVADTESQLAQGFPSGAALSVAESLRLAPG